MQIELQQFCKIKKKIPETVTNEHDKERHASPEERLEIIDELRLK